MNEILRLGKPEVVRMSVEVIMHHHPAVLSYAFPAVGSFVTSGHTIIVVLVHRIGPHDSRRRSVFNGSTALMRHVVKVIDSVVIHDIAIDNVVSSFGSLEEQLGLTLHSGKLIIHVDVVYTIGAIAKACSEVQEQLSLLIVVAGLRCPHAPHLAPLAP